MRHMLINPTYNGIMFMLLEEACRIHWDEMQKSPYEIRPAESRIYARTLKHPVENFRHLMVILREFTKPVVLLMLINGIA